MSNDIFPSENAKAFFAETPDVPPEFLRDGDPAETTTVSANIHQTWEKIAQESRSALKPPPTNLLSCRLANWAKSLDQEQNPVLPTHKAPEEIGALAKSYFDSLVQIDTATGTAKAELDHVEAAIERLVTNGQPQDPPSQEPQPHQSKSPVSLVHRKAALLQLLAWLERIACHAQKGNQKESV